MTIGSPKPFTFFLPISKVDKERRQVSGYASTPALDLDGEIVSLDAVKAALPGYMQWRNIRRMHTPDAVGVAKEANVDHKGLFLTAKIIDDDAWQKCMEGVYKGFSIGGRKLAKNGNTITELEMVEISIVDRPANPECRFEVQKAASADAGAFLMKSPSTSRGRKETKILAKAVDLAANVSEFLTKSEDSRPGPAADGFQRPAKTDPVLCKKHGVADCAKCAMKAAKKAMKKGGNAPGDGSKPYGDVEYADPGLRSDGKSRYPIDTEEHIRAAWNYINKPKNAAKYGDKAERVRAKIISAWKSKIDASGPPSAKEKKAKKSARVARVAAAETLMTQFDLAKSAPTFLTLGAERTKGEHDISLSVRGKKGSGRGLDLAGPLSSLGKGKIAKRLGTAGTLSYCFDQIRDAQRSLMLEAQREGGDQKDKALAKQLGNVAKELAAVIGQKAEHEGAEALDLSDADDQGFNFDLESTNMDKTANKLPLEKFLESFAKRGKTPSRMERMGVARANLKKARKVAADAEEAIKAAHAMHKSAYLAKAARGKKPDADADDFDHAGAMEKLQKAYSDLSTMKTFMKKAGVELKKASSRAGQRGQEVTDGNQFYQVPPGIRDMSGNELSTTGPGSGARVSMPQSLGMESTPSGKMAKKGFISPREAEAIAKAAAAEAKVEILERLPAPTYGGRRPAAFDVNGLVAGGNRSEAEITFKGVDVSAFGSGNEAAHSAAAATAIGNRILGGLGKSIFDVGFHGTAGAGRPASA